ncbi:MAG: class I SAM-dependent methyltransferase [Myxococcota bacterium]
MPRAIPPSHRLFSEWSLYRKVVENDYMEHTAVTRAVGDALRKAPDDASVLDLGCGDAEVVSRLAANRRISSYVGVDQSQAALDCARERLERLVPDLEFERAHMVDFLRTTSQQFDVVLCGYALHHLPTRAKREFFRYAREVLKAGGILMTYDAFYSKHETRDEFVEEYIAWIASDWTEIRPHEHAAIASHMREADLPETLDDFYQIAREAGLSPARKPLWSCRRNYHHLVQMTH